MVKRSALRMKALPSTALMTSMVSVAWSGGDIRKTGFRITIPPTARLSATPSPTHSRPIPATGIEVGNHPYSVLAGEPFGDEVELCCARIEDEIADVAPDVYRYGHDAAAAYAVEPVGYAGAAFGHDELRGRTSGQGVPRAPEKFEAKKQFVRQTAVCIGNEVVREFRRSGVPVEHEEVEQGHEDHARRIVGPEFVAVCLQQFRYGCEGIGRPVEEGADQCFGHPAHDGRRDAVCLSGQHFTQGEIVAGVQQCADSCIGMLSRGRYGDYRGGEQKQQERECVFHMAAIH